tara:strand:- start:1568 stop:1933 length:366 start_codon:yes stop_codon:yes gene_type:complete
MTEIPSYTFAENPDDDSMGGIRITGGNFRGFTYQYGVVSFGDMPDARPSLLKRIWSKISSLFKDNEGTPSLNFTYQIIDNPRGYPVNSELKAIMGRILTELICERYDNGSVDRENNTSTPG